MDGLLAVGQRVEAVALLRSGLRDHPDASALHLRIGTLLTRESETEDALFHLEQARNLDPEAFAAFETLGTHLERLGRFQEAAEAFQKGIQRNPESPGGYYGFIKSKRIDRSDAHIVSALERGLRNLAWSEVEREMSHYGLGKALEDLGEFEQAMAHYERANQLALERRTRQNVRFDREAHRKLIDHIIQTYTPEFVRGKRDMGLDSELPVLIVGMPRSGTTLVEQIVSSHSRVAPGGELSFWRDPATQQVMGRIEADAIPAEAVVEVGKNYRRHLRSIGPRMDRVTDKNPHNYLVLGFIHMLFPRARFVHCRRSPLDTCLSLFTTPCGDGGQNFLHVKENILFAYEEYERLISHWRTLVPEDELIEVDYEELVCNTGLEAKRLVERIGLEWEQACMSPERNERVVHTPSRWQVRQPVYSSSVGRWRRFEPWLGAFAQLQESLAKPYLG